MDISADLIELGRTSIAVVCAGIKSILDIGRTMEFLVSHCEQFSWFQSFICIIKLVCLMFYSMC